LEEALTTAKKNQAIAQRDTYRKERSIAKREKNLAEIVRAHAVVVMLMHADQIYSESTLLTSALMTSQ
jgi:hypothetical protein